MRDTCEVLVAGFAALFAASACLAVEQVGEMPMPTLQGVKVETRVSYDTGENIYTYAYTVHNGAGSTGVISDINIDMVSDSMGFNDSIIQKLYMRYVGTTMVSFNEIKARMEPLLLPPGGQLIPYGADAPDGWSAGLTRDGYASLAALDRAVEIAPGTSMSGFRLFSPGVPVIREMIIVPWWVPVFSEEPGEELQEAAGRVERDIRVRVKTLAPAGRAVLSWSAFEREVARAVELGWISDAGLAAAVEQRLAAAVAAVQQEDGAQVRHELQALLDVLSSAPAGALRPEARDLLRLNAEALLRVTPDTPARVTPEYSLQPAESAYELGETAALVARVVNSSDHDSPLEGRRVLVSIVDGPHVDQGEMSSSFTNAEGEVVFTYRGSRVGTDTVWLSMLAPSAAIHGQDADAEPPERTPWVLAEAKVYWSGAKDLAVPMFIPPVIEARGGETIQLIDWTRNLGREASGPSVTRYYLSASNPVNPKEAVVLGERELPSLSADELSMGEPVQVVLPSELGAGKYYLAACADADTQVFETNEKNNCSFNELENSISIVLGADRELNRPPVCDAAVADPPILWPPNHKLQNVSVGQVLDPDDDEIFISVTGIHQNEPANGVGDGNTSPDGFGLGSPQARVRKERSGSGSGRIYFISFRAEDGQGGGCDGSVQVVVPHDRSGKRLPQDTGVRYDSTLSH